MKILVFDDNEIHRSAAVAQLGKIHDLTVVGTYDEAQGLLITKTDYPEIRKTLKAQFGDFDPNNSNDEVQKGEYFAAERAVTERFTTRPDFDVVLTDLLVPASSQSQNDEGAQYIDMEMPIGIFIALLAGARGRARYAAVFTDSSHHAHPASACFDVFNQTETNPTPFTVNGCKVVLSNTRRWIGQYDPKDLSKALEYEEYSNRSDTVRAKNWATLLEHLMRK